MLCIPNWNILFIDKDCFFIVSKSIAYSWFAGRGIFEVKTQKTYFEALENRWFKLESGNNAQEGEVIHL